jgi:hypothetical protein
MKIGDTDITPKMVADFGLLIMVAIVGVCLIHMLHGILEALEEISRRVILP